MGSSARDSPAALRVSSARANPMCLASSRMWILFTIWTIGWIESSAAISR
jgi:hypothetical protein